jgi:hypothetical protein
MIVVPLEIEGTPPLWIIVGLTVVCMQSHPFPCGQHIVDYQYMPDNETRLILVERP